jgi:hypothetical protein
MKRDRPIFKSFKEKALESIEVRSEYDALAPLFAE